MAAGRKIRDEKEAQRCLLAAKRSGVSIGEWARTHGVDGRSLHVWKINIDRRAVRSAGGAALKPKRRRQALVELVPVPPIQPARGTARYTVEVAGGRVAFGDDASMATLRHVIGVLRSC